jgi:hypothetical protein
MIGDRPSITAEARATLAAALTPAVDPWPMFDTRPLEVPVPCVYIDVVSRRFSSEDGAPVFVVTFPVVAIVDGDDTAQCRQLDVVGDVVWDVVWALDGGAVSADPGTVDVGGPRLRSLVTLADVVVERPTLCTPEVTP